jgi:hypothetical protein
MYNAFDYGPDETKMLSLFRLQLDDARQHFLQVTKPRLDRSYKLYIASNLDRAKKIKPWQSNVNIGYIQAVIETLLPRILDARPEFSVMGRTPENNTKASKQVQLGDYFWEKNKMDKVTEDFVRASLIYGTGFLQVGWKKDVRTLKFLDTKDVNSKKPKWKKRDQVFFDAPFAEWVDNYSIWYDWHNTARESKQFWIKRLVLTNEEIKRKYPSANKRRLEDALASPGGDLTDYASIRQEVKTVHTGIVRGDESNGRSSGIGSTEKFSNTLNDLKMYEVFEWYRPFEDSYAVMVGAANVPILDGGEMPIPFDFKEAPFVDLPYLRIPGEFEGYGIPMILESPQIMLNLIKNQRIDATTLSIHKMWIVNPLANINKEELVTRPFGIIYSVDPNGVREVQFSDVKESAYREEENLKQDMRYSSGVDDFSMGAGNGSSSATEVRHLRESTLERVRLFVNHLGDSYSTVLRMWMSLSRQFMSKEMTIRIIGQDGEALYPLIQRDDLSGEFDYIATVIPSIAGQVDVKKKQDMDMFQLLVTQPFIDPKKLTNKVISDWGWSLDSLLSENPGQQPADPNAPQDPNAQMDPSMQQDPTQLPPDTSGPSAIPQSVLDAAMQTLAQPQQDQSPFAQAASPINLLQQQGPPPTVKGIQANPRGLNRTGKVNTNIPLGNRTPPSSSEMNKAQNIQR